VATPAQVIPFNRGQPSPPQAVGQVPQGYSPGSGTIVTGTAAQPVPRWNRAEFTTRLSWTTSDHWFKRRSTNTPEGDHPFCRVAPFCLRAGRRGGMAPVRPGQGWPRGPRGGRSSARMSRGSANLGGLPGTAAELARATAGHSWRSRTWQRPADGRLSPLETFLSTSPW